MNGGLSRLAVAFGASALVIRRFSINEAGPLFVEIEGRQPGILAWLLSLLRIDDTTTLRVYATHAEISANSLAGHHREIVPLAKMSRLSTSYLKPFGYLILAATTAYWGFYMLSHDDLMFDGLIRLAFAAGFVWLYFFRQCVLMHFMPKSGSSLTIAFKRSVIEGQNIDETAGRRIMDIVQRLVNEKTARSARGFSFSDMPSPPPRRTMPHISSGQFAHDTLPSFSWNGRYTTILLAVIGSCILLAAIFYLLPMFTSLHRKRSPIPPSNASSSSAATITAPARTSPSQPHASSSQPAASSSPPIAAHTTYQDGWTRTSSNGGLHGSRTHLADSSSQTYSDAKPSATHRQYHGGQGREAQTQSPDMHDWAKQKKWFDTQIKTIERGIKLYSDGGYRYNSGMLRMVVSKINALREVLAQDNALDSIRAYNDLKDDYDFFVRMCRWQPNERHSRYEHVLSGNAPNQWKPENGWEFVNPGTSDLTVRQVRQTTYVRCRACLGAGYVMRYSRCRSCQGLGTISRRRCQKCGGSGNHSQRIHCTKCNGVGRCRQ